MKLKNYAFLLALLFGFQLAQAQNLMVNGDLLKVINKMLLYCKNKELVIPKCLRNRSVFTVLGMAQTKPKMRLLCVYYIPCYVLEI